MTALPTPTQVRSAIGRLVDFQTRPATADYVRTWAAPLDRPASGTMRSWFQSHHGDRVDTLQINTADALSDGGVPNAWATLNRVIDAHSRATSVRFDESIRDYRGMTVLAAGPDSLVVADGWHVVLYRLAS